MGIIRSAEADRIARQAVVLDLGDLRRQAEDLEARTKVRAEAMITEARAERERLIQGAAEKGYAAGFAEGRAEGMEQGKRDGREEVLAAVKHHCAELADAWRDALDDFRQRREEIIAAANNDALTLILEICRRVTRRQIEADPGVVRELLRAALASVLKPSSIRIELNPDDEPIATEMVPALMQALHGSIDATLIKNPDLDRGAIIVRDGAGEVDASLSTQIDRIARALVPGDAGPEASPGP